MKKISKDFIKFRQYIRTLELNVNEQYLLELFFEFHNIEFKYCYLKINDILKAFNTTSKNRISNIIKSLEEKNIIEVDRKYKNNRYTIKGVDKFISVIEFKLEENHKAIKKDKNTKKVNVDSNGQKPIDGQIGVEEALEQVEKEEINKIIKATGATEEEAREELRVAKSKEGIKDVVQYTIGTINNKKRNEKELEKTVANKKQEINPKGFNNFPAREYDYDDLERKLLGWDKDEEEEQETEFLN